MPSFSTNEMKVAIGTTKRNGDKRLSPGSIETLKYALEFAIGKEKGMTLVVSFPGNYMLEDDLKGIKMWLEVEHKAEVVHFMHDLVVFKTAKGEVVSVKLCGGSALTVPPANPKEAVAAKPSGAVKPPAVQKKKNTEPETGREKKKARVDTAVDLSDDSSTDEEAATAGGLTQECSGILDSYDLQPMDVSPYFNHKAKLLEHINKGQHTKK